VLHYCSYLGLVIWTNKSMCNFALATITVENMVFWWKLWWPWCIFLRKQSHETPKNKTSYYTTTSTANQPQYHTLAIHTPHSECCMTAWNRLKKIYLFTVGKMHNNSQYHLHMEEQKMPCQFFNFSKGPFSVEK